MPTSEKNTTESVLAEHRRELILDALARGGQCRVTDLAQQFSLSTMTVRRDLQVLEEQGRLRRVHGGAVLVDSEVDYPLRAREGQTQKQRIGQCAAELILDGMVVYLDSGTTAMELARRIRDGLPGVNQLSVVTHGINLAMELAGHPAYDVHLIGGELYRNGLATVGPVAIAQVGQLHFDLFFMGARGVDLEAGWTNANQLETQLKHVAIERSRRICALADSTKWGQRGFVSIAPFEKVSAWVCDDDLPDEARSAAANMGVELLIAG
ncbi:DeoR/GlpR family DNA-binding transcription regulator [Burkholderia sp. JPY481]|uniref:DeoR/GlpR family DNA-binding transcription regulator n=1 Tax=unclassified Paraburkholderia TaxID=2615204 RepID=UPI003171626C